MNIFFRFFKDCPLILLSLCILNGCAGLVAASATGAGVTLAKDKTIGNIVDDFTIRTKIHNDLIMTDLKELFARINVKVSEGKVLLTGYVKTPEDRLEALRIAWSQNGVKEVINEIQVDDQDKFSIGEYSKDAIITAQIRAKLLFHSDIRSVNYNIETIKGVVYIIGIARNHEELELVTSICARVKHVKKVVSHVRVKFNDNNYSKILDNHVEVIQDNNKPSDYSAPIRSNKIKSHQLEEIKQEPANSQYDEYDEFDSFDD